MFHILLLTLVALATADFDCVCNYNPNWPVYDRPSATAESDTLGFLYEFDCKEKLPALTNTAFTAISFEHMVGYIKTNNDVQSQLCPGNPNSFDILTSTKAALTTTAVPSSAATTTEAVTSSRIATSTASVPTTPAPVMTTTTRKIPTTTLKQSQSQTSQAPIVQTSQPVIQGQTSMCSQNLRDAARRYGYSIGQFNQTCYLLRKTKTGWSTAENYCRSHGGHLFDISNSAEQNYIMSFLARHNFKDEVWMGLQDRGNEENFGWTSGEQLTYTNWYPYRKDDIDGHAVEDCAVLIPFPPFNGQWDDLHCGTIPIFNTDSHSHSFICQFGNLSLITFALPIINANSSIK